MQLHVGYYYGGLSNKHPDLVKYTHIFNLGYTFETSSIPLGFDVWIPMMKGFQSSALIFLVGVKIPLATLDFQK
jgi:hypothetical protein